jgi:hypothetical protein
LVLHTWGSALTHHPHVRGIMPGGGLAPDGQRWIACRQGFFLPVRVLPRLFRRRFLEELQQAYLSRYTHRVAISNSRLISMDEHGITFRWKDYRGNKGRRGKTHHKAMTLSPQEFMRRFLLHVPPIGFHRIRHCGLLANGNRRANLALVRELLHVAIGHNQSRRHCRRINSSRVERPRGERRGFLPRGLCTTCPQAARARDHLCARQVAHKP